MTLPRLVIAEDERDQREHLARLLATTWPEAELVASCRDGQEALEALGRHRPNVMFLDIRMPGIDGLEVARAASSRAHIVLTTAYEEYALRAFEAGAIDYLLKPVTPARLAATVMRLRERLVDQPPDIDHLLNQLKESLRPQEVSNRLTWITASAGNEVRLLAVDDVLFFRASAKHVRVVTAEDEALVRLSLKELISRLDPDRFWQIHRSVIVAVAAIEKIERDELGKMFALVRGRSERLPVTASCRHLFRGM